MAKRTRYASKGQLPVLAFILGKACIRVPVQSPFLTHHYLPINAASSAANRDHRIRRMKRALDAADLELVKMMVMGEGLDLDDALAVHYVVQHCGRDVVKALPTSTPAPGPWGRGEDGAAPGGRDGVPRHGVGAPRPPRRPQCQDTRRRHPARRAPQPHLRVHLQGRPPGAHAHRAQQVQALPRARAVRGDGGHTLVIRIVLAQQPQPRSRAWQVVFLLGLFLRASLAGRRICSAASCRVSAWKK
ncbi:unnamed protein product [Miscanthus lutarioriparius]|uniref:Uncharacterized protein n=1 Tax=Miscanthus lutarioriparius TaxID=422564 RepID=A0A811NJJ1_9POAL|nr:unnamed protein product [Miscanthus lutarioriparius]